MSEPMLRADLPGLRRAQAAFPALSAGLEQTLRRLGAALDAEGRCWGRDQIAAAFEPSYLAAASQARTALAGLPEGVRQVGNQLRQVCDSLAAAEERAQSRLTGWARLTGRG